MSPRRESLAFAATLAVVIGGFFHESLFQGKVLSPADVVAVQASFRHVHGPDYEPLNRLLMDPVLQFQPWLEFNRAMLRRGRLPLWNDLAGCGAPYLANGQAAVFDPFHVLAYVGTLPDAFAWMAAARLFVAGLGMFLLARAWGFGPWGRWFAGLAFPFSGFLVLWLLFPVTSVAVWLPWLLLSTDRLWNRPSAARVGGVALAVGLVLLGGHIQTSVHVLLLALFDVGWRLGAEGRRGLKRVAAWSGGVVLGLAIGAVGFVPLGFYLSRSPVWEDRAAEKVSAWAIVPPRPLDAARTAYPYLLGSQRRGQPNLAKAVGAQNLNESAGGFAGLATLVVLAPLGWSSRRITGRAGFLGGVVLIGGMGAFDVPPVANLLRALPVLDVADNRRLTLWLAFGLVALGGIGIDRLGTLRGRGWTCWLAGWALISCSLLVAAGMVGPAGPRLRARAEAHYAHGTDPAEAHARVERQVRAALHFVPRYLAISAGQGLAIVALAVAWRRGKVGGGPARAAFLGLTMADLVGFGIGLNPAVPREDDRPGSPVIAALRRGAGPPDRAVAVGAELPPNMLMRYGLADVRNYDSIELRTTLDFFAPLFEPEAGRPSRSSRRAVSWRGVVRALDRLRAARVAAVVAAGPPPAGVFGYVERVGGAWIAWLPNDPARNVQSDHGRIVVDVPTGHRGPLALAEAFDPGWRAEADGEAAAVAPWGGMFLAVEVPVGARRVVLRYDPPEVRVALAFSTAGFMVAILLVGFARPRSAGFFLPEAWTARRGRVRIDSVVSTGPGARFLTEG
ncbi:MAG TPA: hypothetical protein VG406_11180 [Isosphaeraceae bacterium]|jgi:hypothetical protein|nr:hypothetical protein [Isosphaeraceae bacterium]